MKLLTTLLVLALVPGLCLGFGYLDIRGAGSPLPGFTARGLAYGGVRSLELRDGSSVLTNPAGLARLQEAALSLSIGPGIGRALVLDSLGEDESNWISLSTLFAGVSMPVNRHFSVGAAVSRITDASFDYKHYTYDFQAGQTSYLSEIRTLKVTGGMYEAAGGVSYRAADWLNLGASAGLRFGSVNYDSTYEDVVDPDNDSTLTWTRDFNSFCWHGGLELPLEFGVLGFSWASEDDDYPARAAVGGLLYTDDTGRGAIGAEVEIGDPGGRGSIDARLFGRAFPYDSFEIMGALIFGTPNYEGVETGTTLGLSLGTGIHLGRVELDAGFSWSSLARDTLFLVPGNPDELKDSQALISFGLTLRP